MLLFDPDRRLLAYSSIGLCLPAFIVAGPRITEVSLSLCACRCPTGCDPVFAAMALSLCLSRHGAPAAWLRGSSPHSAGNVSVWMHIQLSRFRREHLFALHLLVFFYGRENRSFLDEKPIKVENSAKKFFELFLCRQVRA